MGRVLSLATAQLYNPWKTKKEMQRERHEKQLKDALERGVKVQKLPAGPKWFPKTDSNSYLQKKVKRLEREVKSLQKERGFTFYDTRAWKELRWRVLVASDGKCNMCGTSKAHGSIMHVDHIKPRSKFPELELEFSNLQVLCEDCNLGKSNK